MKKIFNIILVSGLIVGMQGCAGGAGSDPSYVSADYYQDYNCKQLSAEKKRVGMKLEQMATVQEAEPDTTGQVLGAAITAFAIARGYSVRSNSDDDGYRRLYNQYEVIEQTMIQKECF